MNIELSKRAVACKGWRWMPGMRDGGGNVYLGRRMMAPADVHQWARLAGGAWEWHVSEFGLPDLDDPATLGCLQELARSAWEGVPTCYEVAALRWSWRLASARTLVAALEAAP